MSVRPIMVVYFKKKKKRNGNFVYIPRAEPQPLEIEIHLLNQEIAVRPPEKHSFRRVHTAAPDTTLDRVPRMW